MESTLAHLTAVLFCTAGALSLYRSAPRQQWRARPWPAAAGRLAGGGLFALALVVWIGLLHPATAVFVTLTMAMLLLTAAPFVAALKTTLVGRAP